MKKNIFLKVLIVIGVILFGVLAFIVVKSTATTVAVVPAQQIGAGTTITADMLKRIDVPINTPKGFITDATSVIGQKVKTPVNEGQFLYVNNFMSSWDDYSQGKAIPIDYVVTAIQIPSDRAVGGLITSGDYIDILGVPKSEYAHAGQTAMKNYLGPIAENSYGTKDGINLYWVLANVLVLETNSDLSEADQASVTGVISNNSNSGGGAFYIVALSYSDYLKVRLCEQYCNLWLSIVPEQNRENGPMIDEMIYSQIASLVDAQAQSKFNAEGERIIPQASPDEQEAEPETGESTEETEESPDLGGTGTEFFPDEGETFAETTEEPSSEPVETSENTTTTTEPAAGR